MNDNSRLASKIRELVKVLRKSIDIETGELEISKNQRDQFNSLYESIFEELLWSPGTLVYLNNPSELKAAQTTIDLMWETINSDQIFEEMTGGGYSGLLVNIIGDYTDRVKMLKPTFISIDPQNTDFYVYFDEAMRAWLFGLNNSSLILCCSILETTFKQELYKIGIGLVYKINGRNKTLEGVEAQDLEELINNAAKEKLISQEERKIAHKIRKLRNDAIHRLHQVSYKDTYEAIMNTKKLIEKLLAPAS